MLIRLKKLAEGGSFNQTTAMANSSTLKKFGVGTAVVLLLAVSSIFYMQEHYMNEREVRQFLKEEALPGSGSNKIQELLKKKGFTCSDISKFVRNEYPDKSLTVDFCSRTRMVGLLRGQELRVILISNPERKLHSYEFFAFGVYM